MNLPNKITLTRIFMIPVFIVFFYLEVMPYHHIVAAVIFALAAFTDALDGHIARSRNLVTNLGKFLDPIADKVLVSTAFILLLTNPAVFMLAPFGWAGLVTAGICVSVILGRELIVSGFRMIAAGRNLVLAADKLGKFKTTAQDVSIFLLVAAMSFLDYTFGEVIAYIGLVFFALCTVLTVISGANYIIKNRQVLHETEEQH